MVFWKNSFRNYHKEWAPVLTLYGKSHSEPSHEKGRPLGIKYCHPVRMAAIVTFSKIPLVLDRRNGGTGKVFDIPGEDIACIVPFCYGHPQPRLQSRHRAHKCGCECPRPCTSAKVTIWESCSIRSLPSAGTGMPGRPVAAKNFTKI